MQVLFFVFAILFFGQTILAQKSYASDLEVCRKYLTQEKEHINHSPRIKRESNIPKSPSQDLLDYLKQDTDLFFQLAERSIEFRTSSLKLFFDLASKIENNKPFSAYEIQLLYLNAKARDELNNKLISLLARNRCEIYKYHLRSYHLAKGFWIFRKAALVLAIRTTLDDNYNLSSSLFHKYPLIRRVLNDENTSRGIKSDGLKHEISTYFSFLSLEDKTWTDEIFSIGRKKYIRYLDKNVGAKHIVYERLSSLIENSISFSARSSLKSHERIFSEISWFFDKLGAHTTHIGDLFDKLAYGFIGALAEGFGRTIGQIQWKDGILLKDKYIRNNILSKIKPLDVFWDKTRHKVSGKLIPGFWNHNAIWIGTEEDLKELEIWNHPIVVKYHNKIKQGKSIVEALGMGVVMNTLEHFLNVDDILIARVNDPLSIDETREVILRVLSNIGKGYDYNFDTNSEKDIICSELIMVAFPQIPWKQEPLIGRWSTTPDLLADELFNSQAHFTPWILYLNGKKVEDNLVDAVKGTIGQ